MTQGNGWPRPLSVLVVDERRSIREGLCRLLLALPGVGSVDLVAHPDDLLDAYARRPVDVVVLGTQRAVGTSMEAAQRLVKQAPDVTIVAVGARQDAPALMALGAHAFVAWGAAPPVVQLAVHAAYAQAGVRRTQTAARPAVDLHERELQVLRGMSEGKGNAEIGRDLHLSEDTVKSYGRRLFRKLVVRDRAQAVAVGMRQGLIT